LVYMEKETKKRDTFVKRRCVSVYFCHQIVVFTICNKSCILDFIRSRCHLSSSIPIDLCLINSGEPFHLSSFDSKLLSFEREDFSSRLQFVLTRIDGTIIRGEFYSKEDFCLLDQGTYIPLSNNPKLINNEFLTKLKKATNSKYSTKILSKTTKQSVTNSSKQQPIKRRQSLKSIAIATAFLSRSHR
jgi:hypothetical protein